MFYIVNINTSVSYTIMFCGAFCFPDLFGVSVQRSTDMKLNYGKTIYTFMYGGDPVRVNNIVQAWLTANGFSLVSNFGETYYYYNDAWYGNRCFQYTIDGNVLTIYAWTIGIGKKFVMLDSGAYNNMAGDAYKQVLNSLFSQINLNCPPNPAQDTGTAPFAGAAQDPNMTRDPGTMQNPGAMQNPYAAVPDSSRFVDAFQSEVDARNEKLCTIGFWMSIVGLLLSFMGIMYGVFIYILEIYFATRGLKTRKKGKAIATFIIAGISILIIFAQLAGL